MHVCTVRCDQIKKNLPQEPLFLIVSHYSLAFQNSNTNKNSLFKAVNWIKKFLEQLDIISSSLTHKLDGPHLFIRPKHK